MIPRRFFRVWLDEPVPERLEVFWKQFQVLHPGWEFVTFHNSDTLTWMRPHIRELFDRCATHAGRSDVVRYEAVYRWGGIYVDADVEPLRSFAPLVETGKAFAGWEDERMVCPTVIGAPQTHPAMVDLLDALPNWFNLFEGHPPNRQTGPYLLTRMWRWRDDVTLYPPEAFYPVHWSEKRKLGDPYPEESYCVHHWDAGWLPDGPPQRG